jgi:hypothetical protein
MTYELYELTEDERDFLRNRTYEWVQKAMTDLRSVMCSQVSDADLRRDFENIMGKVALYRKLDND